MVAFEAFKKKNPNQKTKDEVRAEFEALDREYSVEDSDLTNRDLESYLQEFGITVEDIKNKKILDLGSGEQELLSKQAEKYGATVFSLNPKLKKWWTRKRLRGFIFKDPEWKKRSVAATAQEIPFRNQSFDLVVALFSISPYLAMPENREAAVKEILRTLKIGGKLLIAPAYFESFSYGPFLTKEAIESLGYRCSVDINEKRIEIVKLD